MTTKQLANRDERLEALTVPAVKQLLPVGKATDNEIRAFLLFCKAADANPYLKEAYLVKYQEGQPASVVLSLQWYLKRAAHDPAYQSYESGIIVKRNDGYEESTGAVLLPGDTLFGGWCKVYKQGAPVPFQRRVSMQEYDRHQAQWKTMPATMIEKVAIVQCIRRAFPNEFETRARLPVLLEGDVEEGSEQPQKDGLLEAVEAPSKPLASSQNTDAPARAFSSVGEVLQWALKEYGLDRTATATCAGISVTQLAAVDPMWLYQQVKAMKGG